HNRVRLPRARQAGIGNNAHRNTPRATCTTFSLCVATSPTAPASKNIATTCSTSDATPRLTYIIRPQVGHRSRCMSANKGDTPDYEPNHVRPTIMESPLGTCRDCKKNAADAGMLLIVAGAFASHSGTGIAFNTAINAPSSSLPSHSTACTIKSQSQPNACFSQFIKNDI